MLCFVRAVNIFISLFYICFSFFFSFFDFLCWTLGKRWISIGRGIQINHYILTESQQDVFSVNLYASFIIVFETET